MATLNGNDIGIYVEGTLIGCLTSATFSGTNDEIDVTCKDSSGTKQILPGMQTGSIAGEGFFDPTGTYTLDDLVAVWSNKTKVWVVMRDTGSAYLSIRGYAYLIDLSWEAPLNAGSTFSFTFSMTGSITYTNT